MLAYALPSTLRAWEQAGSQACSVCPLCTQLGLASSVTIAASAALGTQAFVVVPSTVTTYGAALSFRGTVTKDAANLVVDLAVSPIAYAGCSGCTVHSGFLAAYSELAPMVLKGVQAALPLSAMSMPLLVTGHSLGGAMATIAAFELSLLGYNVRLLTFGSPRVGNSAFASAITSAVTTHVGVLMGRATLPLPAGLSPLRRLDHAPFIEEDALMVEALAEEPVFSRPSAVLHAVAERLCGAASGGCSGLFSRGRDTHNDSAYATYWNAHVAGKSSRPAAAARGLQDEGGGAPTNRVLGNLWRYVNGWDPVAVAPPANLGYAHVPTELFFTGTSGDGWGLSAAAASVMAPPFLGDYATTLPVPSWESGRPNLLQILDNVHFHDLTEYAYRLLDPVYLRGAGSSSVGFWGPSSVDPAARPLGTVRGPAQGLAGGYTCPSPPPSASPSAYSPPSCNYAPVPDAPVSVTVPTDALNVYRALRTIIAGASAVISLSTTSGVSIDAVSAAARTLASAYTGSVPGVVVGSARRLDAHSNTSFQLVWNFTTIVSSGDLPSANISLLSSSDWSSFEDGLFFAQMHANATISRLSDMFNGVAPPLANCTDIVASKVNSPLAAALGCGNAAVANAQVPLEYYTLAAALCGISVPQAVAMRPVVISSTASASIGELSFQLQPRQVNSTAVSPSLPIAGIVSGAVIGFLLLLGVGFALLRCWVLRRSKRKKAAQIPSAVIEKGSVEVSADQPQVPGWLGGSAAEGESAALPSSQPRPPLLLLEAMRPTLSFAGLVATSGLASVLHDVSSAPNHLRVGRLSVLPALTSEKLEGSLRRQGSAFCMAALSAAPALSLKLEASMAPQAFPLPPSPGRNRALIRQATATFIQSVVRGFLSRRHVARYRVLIHAEREAQRAQHALEALQAATLAAEAANAVVAAAAAAEREENVTEVSAVAALLEDAEWVPPPPPEEPPSRIRERGAAAHLQLRSADLVGAASATGEQSPAAGPRPTTSESALSDSLTLFVRHTDAAHHPPALALPSLKQAQSAAQAAVSLKLHAATAAMNDVERSHRAQEAGMAVLSKEWEVAQSRVAAQKARALRLGPVPGPPKHFRLYH